MRLQMKAAGHAFEVVFVSADRDPASFKDYYAHMPWLAVDYEDDEVGIDAVKSFYSEAYLLPPSMKMYTSGSRVTYIIE